MMIMNILIISSSIVLATANQVKITSLSEQLAYDENNRLLDHAVLYVDSPDCTEGIVKAAGEFQSFALEGAAKELVFPNHGETTECQAACIERGVERTLAGNIMDYKYYNASENFATWIDGCRRAEVCFVNYHEGKGPLKTFWVGHDGDLVPQGEIRYGFDHTKCLDSFIGHRFIVKDLEDNLVADYTIEITKTIAFGRPPPSGTPHGREFENEINGTLRNEWKRHNRVTRSFSPLGFKKGRLPLDVLASMGTFYYNNREDVLNEEWNAKGVFVNWWETDVGLIHIPPQIKLKWQKSLLALVEAWAGVPIEQTLMYGMREYRSGARLLSHVDRHETHAVSLIVNVAQGNLDEPWPVEVFDHQDRLHEITMEPGEIVYYESAKCLHSRNRPLRGDSAYYVNLFTHYKPITGAGETWWNQPNHEGAPDPVLDVEGECKLVPKGLSAQGNGGLGLVSGVQCDDPRLGSFVSPGMYQAKDAEDMIQWWKMTSPNSVDEEQASSADETPQVNEVDESMQQADGGDKMDKEEL